MVLVRTMTTRKEDLFRDIAADLGVHPATVDRVVHRFLDIAVESMVNEGEFPLQGIVLVKESDYSPSPGPNGETLPPQKRISVRLSRNIRNLYRLQHDSFSNKPYIINRDTWRDALSWKKNNPDQLS